MWTAGRDDWGHCAVPCLFVNKTMAILDGVVLFTKVLDIQVVRSNQF